MPTRLRLLRTSLVAVALVASLIGAGPAGPGAAPPEMPTSDGAPGTTGTSAVEHATGAAGTTGAGHATDAEPAAGTHGATGSPATPLSTTGLLTVATPDWQGGTLRREVYGYLPYWELDAGIEGYLRYDLLSTISFFGVPINPNGSLGTASRGYEAATSARAARIVTAAHAAGVRAELTFTSFGLERNRRFFRNSPARRAFVRRAAALVREYGFDGANIDVELLSKRWYRAYGILVRELKQALVADNPLAQVSVATNANVSGAKMAALAVANGADRVFMMGYDYRWSGSAESGAIDPVVRASGGLSLTASLRLYERYGVPLDHVIMGVGYYGRTWPTAGSRLRAPVQRDRDRYGGSRVFFPRSLPKAAAGARATHDRVEHAARLVRWDRARRTWVQTYYNDPRAIAVKLDLAHERNLAGMGIWALGYDRGQTGYWETIDAAFRLPPPAVTVSAVVPPAGSPGDPKVTANVTASTFVHLRVTHAGTTSAPTEVSLSNDGTTWSPWLPLGETIPWTLAPGPDGERTVHVQLRDATGSAFGPFTQRVVVDTAAPRVAAPRVSIPRRARTGVATAPVRVSWSADDLSGVTRYELERSLAGGPWVPMALASPTATDATLLLPPGSYRFRVRATDAAGTASEPVEGEAVRVALTQDTSRAIRLSAGWRRVPGTSASGGGLSSTTRRGATATYRFTGTGIGILGSIGPGRGRATVTVDGVTNSFVAGAPRRSARWVLFSKALPPGRHTLVVRVDGTPGRPAIDLDAFVVLP